MAPPLTPSFPFDDTLPGASVLLDPVRMRPRAQEGLGSNLLINRLQVRHIDYVPHMSLAVRYRAEVGTVRFDLMAQIGHPVPDSKQIDHLKAISRDRRTARLPVIRCMDLGAHVTWYPIDFGIPLLCVSDVEIADLVGLDSAGPTTHIAWRPGQYSVMRYPNAFVRVYRDPAHAFTSSNALRLVEGHLPIATMLSANEERGLVSQTLRAGLRVKRDKAADAAPAVARLMQALHDVDASAFDPEGSLPRNDPASLIAAAKESASLVAFCRPDLADRIAAIFARLELNAPTGLALVPSHGDFSVSNVFQHAEELFFLDVDTLCLAPSAYDLATYAASSVSGQPEAYEEIMATVKLLKDAYAIPVEALDWHVAAMAMRHIDEPFRRYERDWSARTDVLLAAAERCLP